MVCTGTVLNVGFFGKVSQVPMSVCGGDERRWVEQETRAFSPCFTLAAGRDSYAQHEGTREGT